MITIYLQGGLGNQLFQIFTCISYAMKHNIEFKLPLYNQNQKISVSPTGAPRPTYWDSIFSSLSQYIVENNELYNNKPMFKEKSFEYNEIPKISEDFILFGYYQSDKYFNDNFNKIYDLLNIRESRDKVKEKYKYLFDNNETISMHFRLGDYKKLLHAHKIISLKYYESCLKKIIKRNEKLFTVIYFCEDEDILEITENINYLKSKFKNLNFKRGKCKTDWEEMLLMSNCNHNIIANSSFSWWGAYLNNNKNKIVCRPKKWFAEKKELKDLCPNNWIVI